MSERDDEGEVDEKLPSPAEGLAGMMVRPWFRDQDVVKSGQVQLGSSEMGLSMTEKLRRCDQIGDGFERRDQTGDGFERRDQTSRAVGRGLDLGFTGNSSLHPLAWAWCE